jgi:hypothetical protein
MNYLTATSPFLLLSISMITSAIAVPSKCSTVIAQSKSAISNLTRFDISKLSKYDGIPPKGKTQHLTIISSVVQESIQLKMAKTIITSTGRRK